VLKIKRKTKPKNNQSRSPVFTFILVGGQFASMPHHSQKAPKQQRTNNILKIKMKIKPKNKQSRVAVVYLSWKGSNSPRSHTTRQLCHSFWCISVTFLSVKLFQSAL